MAKVELVKRIAPNGLRTTVWRADGVELEHEHADHRTYVFPVEVTFVGKRPKLPKWDVYSYSNEEHALIYTDGSVAVTMYEYCYAMWYLRDGKLGGGSLWRGDWRLTAKSLKAILKYARASEKRPAKGTVKR